MTYSSPSHTARVRSEARSEPAWGSLETPGTTPRRPQDGGQVRRLLLGAGLRDEGRAGVQEGHEHDADVGAPRRSVSLEEDQVLGGRGAAAADLPVGQLMPAYPGRTASAARRCRRPDGPPSRSGPPGRADGGQDLVQPLRPARREGLFFGGVTQVHGRRVYGRSDGPSDPAQGRSHGPDGTTSGKAPATASSQRLMASTVSRPGSGGGRERGVAPARPGPRSRSRGAPRSKPLDHLGARCALQRPGRGATRRGCRGVAGSPAGGRDVGRKPRRRMADSATTSSGPQVSRAASPRAHRPGSPSPCSRRGGRRAPAGLAPEPDRDALLGGRRLTRIPSKETVSESNDTAFAPARPERPAGPDGVVVAAQRHSHGTPTAPYSSRCQPRPTPRSTRPPERVVEGGRSWRATRRAGGVMSTPRCPGAQCWWRRRWRPASSAARPRVARAESARVRLHVGAPHDVVGQDHP